MRKGSEVMCVQNYAMLYVQEGMYNELYNKADIIVQHEGQIIVQEEKGPCPGSLPSQPRSPFALHSFYWPAVTPFVRLAIIIIIIIHISSSSPSSSSSSQSHWRNIMSQLVAADCLPHRQLRA